MILSMIAGWPHPTAAQTRPTRIIAFGDSLTAGYLLPDRASFPSALERALKSTGANVEVVNAGVSGDTASGGLARLEWAIADGADALILELGANDMLRGLDPDITYKALAEIMTRLKQKGVKVLIAGMIAAPGMGRAYEDKFNAIFPRLAREFDAPLYPFFMEGVASDPKLLMPDGLHPTAAGVEMIVKGILPAVQALIASIEKRS